MDIRKVRGCCSMLTIYNNPEMDKFSSKYKFLLQLNYAIDDYNKLRIQDQEFADNNDYIEKHRVKTVIIVTNNNWFKRPFWLKKAYSYQGNNENRAKVCYVNFRKGL